MTQRVFVDANVLFSRTLRDWLFLLREETGSMFQLHSTEDVLAEVVYRLRRAYPDRNGVETTRLRSVFEQNLDELVSDFDTSIEYHGSDPNDRHVHAAAVAGRSDILLTADYGFYNLADTDDLPYSVYGCDDFFLLVDDSDSASVLRVTDRQRHYWATRHNGGRSIVGALGASGCSNFAVRVNQHLRTLSGPTARPTRLVSKDRS